MSNYDYSNLNNYEMKKEIGEGNFGKVKLAVFKPTGEEFAIKILNKEKIKKQMKSVILRENDIITQLNHINIVFVYKIIDTPEEYYIVMEYCKLGELFDYIVKKKRLSEEESSVFFYQLINGVEYIHSKGIAHRDLKPENLLLTEDKVLKIIDFGLSHEFNEEEFLKTKCGSPSYAAPEIIARPKYNGFKIDIWCCGIILYAMLCGYLPFEGNSESEANNNAELFRNILECEPEYPDFLSEQSKDLIYEILNPNPDERISIKQIKKHPFYLKGKQLCKIDYNSYYEEVVKTRESFYKNNNEEKKHNNNIIHLMKKKNSFSENNNKTYKNYNNITTEGNIKSNAKNSIDYMTNNKYKFTINDDINKFPSSLENNIDKVYKAKLKLLSLKTKIKQKNEINSFKRKNNPINLHNYPKKVDNINKQINQILATEANESPHLGLPFIGLKDTYYNFLLSSKIKRNFDKTNNNSLNIRKQEEENNLINYSKSPNKFGPQIPTKINKNSLEYKVNSCSKSRKPNIIKHQMGENQYIFENMKLNININKTNNEDLLSNICKNPKKKGNLNANNKMVKAYTPGNIALSLTNDNMNKRKKYNRYNYDYHYNFETSPNKKLLVKEMCDSLNNTNNMNKSNNINITNNMNKDIKTIMPINIKQSEQNIKTILKKHSRGDNKNYCKSPEIKSIFNNIKINININSNTVGKEREKNKDSLKTLNSNNKVKYSYNIDLPNNSLDKKLYMLTDANKDINNNNFRSIAISPDKNYINNSERSNKRKGISLPKDNIKYTNYNLSKIIQNVKNGNNKIIKNELIKKNKSFSSIGNTSTELNKKNHDGIKIKNVNEKNCKDKKNIREDLLKYILFNTKNYHQNNKNNLLTLNNINNHFLPKLNGHIYNNHNSEKKV